MSESNPGTLVDGTIPSTEQPSSSSQPSDNSTIPINTTHDTDEDFITDDNVAESSDSEYDSDYGIEDFAGVDSESDTVDEDEDTMEVPYRVQTSLDMGRQILLEFPSPVKYSTSICVEDEQRDIFDDGLESDAESSDSDASSNYEDIDEHENIRIVRVSGSPEISEDNEEELDDNMTDAFDSDRAYTSEVDDDISPENDDEPSEQEVSVQDPTPLAPKSFSELQQHKYKLLYDGKLAREKQSDAIRWKILELEEQKRHIEQELPLLEQELDAAETLREEKEQELTSILEASGISHDLQEAYEAFCESLIPESGQRGGFSIACEGTHGGSYVKYDPDFKLFKEFIEPLETTNKGYNYRCEASVTFEWGKTVVRDGKLTTPRETVNVVEFWPLKPPVLANGAGTTWGDQYPELYELVEQAVHTGSAAASEMLIALPNKFSACDGGWLFEYHYQEVLAQEPIIARRWTFGSAHVIDSDDM